VWSAVLSLNFCQFHTSYVNTITGFTSLPSNLRPDHTRRVVCSAIWRIPMNIADRSWAMLEQAFATCFAPVTDYLHIYKVDPYPTENIPDVRKWTSPTSRLSKVIVWQAGIHHYNTTPLRGWSIIGLYQSSHTLILQRFSLSCKSIGLLCTAISHSCKMLKFRLLTDFLI